MPSGGGAPRTIVVPGNGTNSLSFVIEPGVTLDVESVLAGVDATGAGGPVTATLSVSEQAGVVIANKRQGETVDAGVTGSATWALRLADDAASGSGPTSTAYEAFRAVAFTVVAAGAVGTLPFVHEFGAFLGAYVGNRFRFTAAGTYAISLYIQSGPMPAAYLIHASWRITFGATAQAFVTTATAATPMPLTGGGPLFAITRPFAAGDEIDCRVSTTSPIGAQMILLGGICKLA